VAETGSAEGDRVVVLDELAAEAGEDGRAVGEARAVLLADAGGRASDANTIRDDDATDRAVAPSGKLTMIARPNQIAEEKGGRKECPRNRRGGYSIIRLSPGRYGIALFFDRNSSFALAIRLKSRMIRANQD
jgi:hypothetical protein